MTPKEKQNYNKMLQALRNIHKNYMTPAQIKRDADHPERGIGIDYEEYLEMAYENIQNEAKQASKGIKELK